MIEIVCDRDKRREMMTKEKTCYCHTCKKDFHQLGVARHRAMHRDKKQDCRISFTHGDTYEWRYSK